MHIDAYFQVRALLDTLQLLQDAKNGGHLRVYSTLLIGYKKYSGEQRVCSRPFKGRQLQKSIRQDMVMVRPPGIDKVVSSWWSTMFGSARCCSFFFLVSQNDLAREQHDCAFVSVLEEYKGRRRPGSIYLQTIYLYAYFTYSAYFRLQDGLIRWTLRWSMSARATSKHYMFCLSHPAWGAGDDSLYKISLFCPIPEVI